MPTQTVRTRLHRFAGVLTAACALLGPADALLASDARAVKLTDRLFEVQTRTLDNGLFIIEQPHSLSDTLMLHLVVDVGLRDFPCQSRQIPHLIEHVLFENNTRFDPETLRRQLRDLGGMSIGWTTDETTHYSVSVHSDHAAQAIDTLTTMVHDIRWDEDDMARVRRIVDTEIETPISPIQRWYDSQPALLDQAKAALYPATSLDCAERSGAYHLSTEAVRSAHARHYRAGNMTLIIIGALPAPLRDRLDEGLAAIPAGTEPTTFVVRPPPRHSPIHQKSAFGTSTAWVYLLTRAPGHTHDDHAAMDVLTEYLNERLFAEVRLKHGLGYTPKADLVSESAMGQLQAFTKSRSDLVRDTEHVFRQVYDHVRNHPPGADEVARLKRKLILAFEARDRTGQELAELYRHYRHRILKDGTMPSLTAQYAAVSVEDVRRVARDWLPETPVVAVLRPPTQSEASLTVTGIIVAAALLAWPLNRWLQRRRQEEQDDA